MTQKARQINIRVTDEERETILAKAKAYGLDLSTYLRLILKIGRLPKIQKS